MSTKKCVKGIANNFLAVVAKEYKATYKIANRIGVYHGKMNEVLGAKIAKAYTLGKHEPNDIAVQNCYQALAWQILRQYRFLMQKVKMRITPTEDIPYNNSSSEMIKDVHKHNHLFYQTTESAFGNEPTPATNENILLERSGLLNEKGEPLLINDLFRIVHDLFGHAMFNFSFSGVGEDKAWWTHHDMFSPLARVAMTTELRGQSTWFNYGSHLRVNGELPPKDHELFLPFAEREYAEQKMFLLPAEFTGVKIISKGNLFFAKTLKNWNPLTGICKKQKVA